MPPGGSPHPPVPGRPAGRWPDWPARGVSDGVGELHPLTIAVVMYRCWRMVLCHRLVGDTLLAASSAVVGSGCGTVVLVRA
jgi:hypothetical protein